MLLTIAQQIDIPAALQVLLGLALAVFGFWFIPAAIGAVAAINEATKSSEDAMGDNPGHESAASRSRYYNPMGKGKMGLSGIHGDWQDVGNVADSSRRGVWDQRWNAQTSRQRQLGALDQLGQYASGEKSAARLAANAAIDQNQSAMASQAAAAGNSPAAQRAAMYGSAAAGQNVAGNVASAAAREQLAAQGAVLQGTGALRSGDAASMGMEQRYLQGNRAFSLGQKQAQLNALGMGMNQVENERQASMGYDKAVRNSIASQQQAAVAERGQNMQLLGQGMSAAAQAFSGAAASDKSVKEGERPVSGEDIFGAANSALMARDRESAVQLAARQADYAGPNNGPGEWLDPYDPANRLVFEEQDRPDESFDAMVRRQTMEDFGDPRTRAQRENDLGQRQLMANMGQKKKAKPLTGAQRRKDNTSSMKSSLKFGLGRLASDSEVKKEKKIAREVVDNLQAYTYRYKDPGAKGQIPGRQLGVMAQDLEKTPAGDKLVTETGKDGTKMVDYGKSGPLAFAALADLNDRLKKLEGGGEGGVDFSDEPLQVRGRAPSKAPQGESSWMQPQREAKPPIPVTQPNVAVMRDGVPVAGSNMGTANWLANEGGAAEPTARIYAPDPEAAAAYVQQQRDEEERRIAEYQMAAARGLPPPGVTPPAQWRPYGPLPSPRDVYATRDVVGDYGRVNIDPLVRR